MSKIAVGVSEALGFVDSLHRQNVPPSVAEQFMVLMLDLVWPGLELAKQSWACSLMVTCVLGLWEDQMRYWHVKLGGHAWS